MRLSRAEAHIVDFLLASPGRSIFDVLVQVKRAHQLTFDETRLGLIHLLNVGVMKMDRKQSRVYFNRNQPHVYRGVV
jgi:hypothetical protein